MKLWKTFKHQVEKNIFNNAESGVKDLEYWRNKLFANILIYLLPVSLIALVPGVVMSFVGNIPLLAFFDLLAALLFLILAIYRAPGLFIRKICLVLILYLLSIVLLMFLGSMGPGLLYLLALTVFIALIFPFKISVWSILINLLICILFAFIIENEVVKFQYY